MKKSSNAAEIYFWARFFYTQKNTAYLQRHILPTLMQTF